MTPMEAAAELRAIAKTVERLAKLPPRVELASGLTVAFGKSKNADRCKTWRDGRKRAREPVTTIDRHMSQGMSRHGQDTVQGGIASTVPPDPPLTPSGPSEVNPSNSPVLASGSRPVRERARRKRRAVEVPAELDPKFAPDADLVNALAVKYQVKPGRIVLELPEFVWFWTQGKGAGKRKTSRGWNSAFSNRIEQVAKSGALYAEPQRNASSRDGTPIVQHPVFKPERPIPANERIKPEEIDGMLSKVGRVAP